MRYLSSEKFKASLIYIFATILFVICAAICVYQKEYRNNSMSVLANANEQGDTASTGSDVSLFAATLPSGATSWDDVLSLELLTDGTYSVTGLNDSYSTITGLDIPSATSDGTAITTIAENAFKGNTYLTSITIPESITSIGAQAFYGCTYLTEIIYNATNCADLTGSSNVFYYSGQTDSGIDVIVGAKVTKIPAYLFSTSYGGSSVNITTVTFEEGSECTSIGSYAFWRAVLTSINIPESVTSIGSGAFQYCSSLTSINIPESVTSIANYVFSGCTQLSDVTIHENITSIERYAFQGCTSLTSITIPEGVTSIGAGAFYGCTYLTEIIYNATSCADLKVDANNVADVFYNAGTAGTGIEVIVGANVTKIPNNLFRTSTATYAPKITTVNFEDGSECISIGTGAFYNCSSLTAITIPAGVTAIAEVVFYGCTQLSDVTIHENITSIGANSFYNCSSLTTITLPESITSIGNQAFYGCTGLIEIIYNATSCADKTTTSSNVFYRAGRSGTGIELTIGENVAKIPKYLFYISSTTYSPKITKINYNATSCADLTSSSYAFYRAGQSGTGIEVIVGANVESIPAYLFSSGSTSYAPKITTVTFEENSVCTSIGTYAFGYCSNLTTITIPENVTSIGASAFYNCSSLTTITIPAGVTTIASSTFYGCTKLSDVTIHENITSIGSGSFNGCSSLITITIPASVTSIGSSAFSGCTGLNEINYNATSLANLTTSSNVFSNAGTAGDGIEVTIGENVTKLPNYLFYISSATYAPKITKIKYNATSCAALTSSSNVFYNAGQTGDGIEVVVGANVTKIPNYLFYVSSATYSPKITTVTFEDNSVCTSIGAYAFRYCSSLSAITIPESITGLGNYVFANCTGLTEINYNATSCADLTSTSSNVFYYAGSSGTGIELTIAENVEKNTKLFVLYKFCNIFTKDYKDKLQRNKLCRFSK